MMAASTKEDMVQGPLDPHATLTKVALTEKVTALVMEEVEMSNF